MNCKLLITERKWILDSNENLKITILISWQSETVNTGHFPLSLYIVKQVSNYAQLIS